MRILITGGAGCLGSNLIEHLLPKGHELCVVDNYATGNRAFLPEHHEGLTIHEGSVCDEAFLEKVFDDFEPTHVIHSAAAYKDPDDWREDARTNVEGSIIVTRACEKADVELLTNFQTALCYGRPEKTPIPVGSPARPFTSYGISKAAGEQFMMMSSVPVVSLRLANITGPRLAIGPIPTFYKRLKAGQSCFCSDTSRDFLDMSDFFSLMDALLVGKPEPGVYNISTGEGHTIKEIFDVVADYLGIENKDVPIVPPRDDDVPVVVLDPGQTEEKLGWKAEVPFKEAVIRTLEWYDKYGVGAVHSHLKPAESK